MSVFEFLDTAYLRAQLDRLSNLNMTLTELRDAIRGADSRTLTDLYNTLYDPDNAKTAAKWLADIYNKLGSIGGTVSIGNFPSWFTGSTKTTDDIYGKLDALDDALASVGTDKLRATLVDSLPSGDNWIGRVKLGDGSNIVAVISTDIGGSNYSGLAVAPDLTAVFAAGTAYTEQEVTASTSEASSSFSPPLKMVRLCNEGDVDVAIKLNGSSTSKNLPAKACKTIALWKVESISYATASGSSTLRIEGYW